MRTTTIAFVLGTGLASTAARAEDAPGPDRAHAFVAGHLALNAPLGELGLEAGIGLGWFRLAASAGHGLRGVEHALMARAMFSPAVQHGVQWGIGLGVSRGPAINDLNVGWDDGDDVSDVHFGAGTLWRSVEVVVEYTGRGGRFFRAYAGVTDPFSIQCVAEDPVTHEELGCTADDHARLDDALALPYVGFAVGTRWPAPPRDPARVPVTPWWQYGGPPMIPPPPPPIVPPPL